MNGLSLTRGDAVAVPASVILFPDAETAGPPLASSTGTAIRDTTAGATRHALLELTERDAVAAWWYNRIVPHRLPAKTSVAQLSPELGSYLAERERLVWHLVLDTDLPVAVVVAVSCRADGTRPALGAAAAPSLTVAVGASTLEMMQVEVSLEQMRAAAEAGVIEPPPLLAWSERTDALRLAMLHGTTERPPAGPPPADADALVAAMTAAGIDVVAVDLTRPEIGIPVVRVVSPHLRDWGPRFAPGRLFELPVALGLRTAPLTEPELNEPFVL